MDAVLERAGPRRLVRGLCVGLVLIPFIRAGPEVAAQERHEEPAPAPSLTLAEARALALTRGFDLLAARYDVDLAGAQRVVAGALPNPQLSATVAKLSTNDLPAGTTPSGSARDTVVALGQLVEIGKRGPRIHAADAGIEVARSRFDFTRVELDASVVKAYVAALAADEAARINRATAASLRRSAEIAAMRFEAGQISQAERDQVQIAAGRFAADTATAEAAAVQARIALQRLLGDTHPDGRVVLTDHLGRLSYLGASLLVRIAGPPAPDAGPAPEALVAARGDVRAARAAVDQAGADLGLQKALRIPDPTLLVQYERDLSLPVPDSVGAGLSLSLPILSRNRGGIRAAEVAQQSANRMLEQTKARALAEVAAARTAFVAASQRRALVHDDLLPRAESVERTVAFAYEEGGASLLELLEAERNLNDLRATALSVRAEALAAAADLAAALGERLE